MSNTVYYTLKDLMKAFQEAGLYTGKKLVGFYVRVHRLESLGRLTTMRNPVTGRRLFTKEHLKEIVEAMKPYGSGCWYHEKPALDKKEKRILKLESLQGTEPIVDIQIEGE